LQQSGDGGLVPRGQGGGRNEKEVGRKRIEGVREVVLRKH